MRRGDVGDILVQVVGAHRGDLGRLGAHQAQDHRDVVRCEAPQDVFFLAHLPEIQAVRIDILDAAQFTVLHHGLQLQEGGVVLQQMADHQGATGRPGQRAELDGIRRIKRQRLFDKDMLAGVQGFPGHLRVQGGRGGDHHADDLGVGNDLCPAHRRNAVLRGHRLGQNRVCIATGRERAQSMNIAHKILAPIAAAGHGKAGGCRHRHRKFVF
jgi:hypothetical protein